MNLPTIPGQKASGENGARVVSVHDRIGRKTSPAALFAARTIFGSFRCVLCVFSITTIASSTTIPSAKIKPNITIIFMVNQRLGIIM